MDLELYKERNWLNEVNLNWKMPPSPQSYTPNTPDL